MLKPLVPHDPLTADLGFRAQRRQALSPLPPQLLVLGTGRKILSKHPLSHGVCSGRQGRAQILGLQ